jgi:hypothetical protein
LQTAVATTVLSPAPPTYGWWPSNAALNTPIGATPQLDASSTAIATALTSGSHIIDVIEYGVPVYFATVSTPRWNLTPTEPWGANPFAGRTVPIDMSWHPQAVAADGALACVDTDGKTVYGFYELDLSGSSPTLSWGGIADRSTKTFSDTLPGNATGSGFSRGAGLLREDECASGAIEHALVFSTDIAKPTTFRAPAVRTDGSNLRGSSVTIEEGTRVQLDPTYNVDGDANLRTYERLVAKALQTYGAYCIDNGGASMAIIAERPHDAVMPSTVNSSAYAGVGITKDYAGLSNIPWNRLRVLAP